MKKCVMITRYGTTIEEKKLNDEDKIKIIKKIRE